MFEVIKGIDIGQGPGKAFGGGIYGASCEIGFSNGPTKIVLNVASEDGKYQSIVPNVYSTKYNINMNGKTFPGMFLYEFEKTKSAGSSLLVVHFIDGSVVLDKIYIGLLNRQGNAQKETNLQTASFSVRCPSCSNGQLTTINGEVRRYVDGIPNSHYFEKAVDGGGFIILGKEALPESNCEIPKVDYNFSELCAALTDFGIRHELSSYDLNPLYRQEYVGTLREVLNNWASDFSFEFYWEDGVLKAIDLRRPINLDTIQSFVDNSQFVTESSYKESLENSYTQTVVARYLKASSSREYSNTFHYKKAADPIFLSHILKNGTCAGRAGNVLLISVALARIDPALREAYLANMAAIYNDFRPLEALGFRNHAPEGVPIWLEGTAKATVVERSQFCLQQSSPAFNSCKPENFAVCVGLFREDIKQKVQNWDTEAADFIGKYYAFEDDVPTRRFECPFASDWFIYYTYNSNWSTLPASDTYGGDGLPFARLLQDPASDVPNFAQFRAKNLFECQDNSWGIEQATYDAAKATSDYESYKPLIIPFDTLGLNAGMELRLLQQTAMNAMPASWATTLSTLEKDSLENGTIVAYCVIPLLNTIPSAPKISSLVGRTVNPLVYQRVTSRTNDDETAPRCLTYCDSSIVSEICNCGIQYTPVPYFKNITAPFFRVKHSNGALSDIIFPVDAVYFGYFVQDRYYKTTYPPVKKIYGEPTHSPNNTLGTRILDYDITPDIDAIMDENDAINLHIYSATNGEIMTAQEYYDELANLNNLVVPSQKSLSFSVARADLTDLGIDISPANGLIGLSLSLTDGGVQTNFQYATRPPVVPNPEAVFTKVKFRLKGKT